MPVKSLSFVALSDIIFKKYISDITTKKQVNYKMNAETIDAKERIKNIRDTLGITRKEFGAKSGISTNTLRAWESGTNPISPKVAKKLAQGFAKCGIQCQPEWILDGVGLSPREFSDQIAMDDSLSTKDAGWDDSIAILKEIQFFESQHTDAVVIAIADDSMEPMYSIGEYVGGIKVQGKDIDNLIGQPCIIEDETGYIYVRKLQKGLTPNTYTFYSLNPKTSAQEPIIFNRKAITAAKIIWHRKQL